VEARRTFVKSGGLQTIQSIKATNPVLKEHISDINSLYPPDVVQYYSPDYAEGLMKKIEDYNPTG